MAATSVTLVKSTCGKFDLDGQREYTSVYRVLTNSRSDGPITVIGAPGIPAFGSTYSAGNDFDTRAVVVSFGPVDLESEKDSLKQWLCTVNYSTQLVKKCEDFDIDNPLAEPPIISGDFIQGEVLLTKDSAGNDIKNSAEDYYDGLTKEVARPSLEIQKNFAYVDLDFLRQYINTTNSGTFFGVAANYWRFTRCRWQRVFRGTCQPYYQVQYGFDLDPDKWQISPVDRGWYYKSGSNKLRVVDANFQPLSTQANLNGSGGLLTLGSTLQYRGPFTVYAAKDFGQLGIPTSFNMV